MITSGNVLKVNTSVVTDIPICDIPIDGLVLSYPLTGTAEDETGTNDGTETSMEYVYYDSMGIVSNFNGTSSYIVTPALNDILGSWSISFWVKPLNADYLHFFVAPNQGTFACKYYKTDEYIFIYNSSYGSFTSGNNSVPTDIFSHILITSSADGSKIYVNGVLSTTDPNNYTISNTSYSIGKYNAERSNMNLSNLHLYNRVLTTEEITNIYNLENNRHNFPVDKGLLSYYPLEDNSLDNSTGQYDGTDNNISYVYDADFNTNVAKFNGGSSYINLNTEVFRFNDPFTISVWVNEHSFTSAENSIIEITSGTYPNDTILVMGGKTDNSGKNRRLYIRNYTSNELYINSGSPTHPADTWRQLVLSWDGIDMRGYEDGSILGTSSFTFSNPFDQPNTIEVGRSAGNRYLDGKISNFRIYNRALSQQEITQIYEHEKPNSDLCKFDITTNDYDPFKDGSGLALWRFDNDLTDASGNYDLVGSSLFNTTGVFNNSFLFDGTERSIQRGIVPEFKLQEHTMSCWVSLNNNSGSTQEIISNHSEVRGSGDQNNSGSFIYIDSNNKVSSSYLVIDTENYTNSNGFTFTDYAITNIASSALQVNEWYHICSVYYGTSSKLFINGVLECSVASNQTINWNGSSSYFSVGSRELNYDNYHYHLADSGVDQVRFFNRALTVAEVLSLYNERY